LAVLQHSTIAFALIASGSIHGRRALLPQGLTGAVCMNACFKGTAIALSCHDMHRAVASSSDQDVDTAVSSIICRLLVHQMMQV